LILTAELELSCRQSSNGLTGGYRLIRILVVIALITILSVTAFGQNENSAWTSGLTSVFVHVSGNTFIWTVTNNTGQLDANPLWDVIIWSVQPIGIPDPIRTEAPAGWHWKSKGHSNFEIKQANQKYKSNPAIAPGESMLFIMEFDPDNIPDPQSISFITHVGAVKPTPVESGGVKTWTPMVVDGQPSWFDKSTVEHSETPEPSAILPVLLLCSAFASLIKLKTRD